MAIKYTSTDQSNIPTLTDIVTDKPEEKPAAADSLSFDQIHPKFEKLLEKLIQKKLQQQITVSSQALAADIMLELRKQLAPKNKASGKSKN